MWLHNAANLYLLLQKARKSVFPLFHLFLHHIMSQMHLLLSLFCTHILRQSMTDNNESDNLDRSRELEFFSHPPLDLSVSNCSACSFLCSGALHNPSSLFLKPGSKICGMHILGERERLF